MNLATASRTLELHAIGDVEFRRVFIDCGIASCHACHRAPSHGPYWFATWIEGGQPRECMVGRELKLDDLRAKLTRVGYHHDKAIVGLFRRIESFEQRMQEEAAAHKRRIEAAARAGERERLAWEKIKQRRVEQESAATTPEPEARRAHADRKRQEQTTSTTTQSSRSHSQQQSSSTNANGAASQGPSRTSQERTGTARPPLTGPWKVLGIPPSSSPSEIKHRYRTLAMECHPDRGGDPEDMKRLNAALLQLERLGAV